MQSAPTISNIIRLFNQLTPSEKIKVAARINKDTFEEQWKAFDLELPDAPFTEDEVLKEVMSVRYGKK